MKDTKVYRYLTGSKLGREAYQEYVDLCNVSFRSFDNYDALKANLLERGSGYNPLKGSIIIDQDYLVLDGQHRTCLLLYQYGAHYKVRVVQLFLEKYRYSLRRKLKILFARIRIKLIH